MRDFLIEVEEFDDWLRKAESGVNEADNKLNQGWADLLLEKKKQDTKLKVALLEEAVKGKKRLQLLSATCEKMRLLPAESKATVFMRNNLKQVMKVVKNEMKEDEEFLECIICWSNGDNHQVPTRSKMLKV